MRPIHVARLDKPRPVLVLTRSVALDRMRNVTVAPITSTVRGLSTEVPVGPNHELDHVGVVSLDNVRTIPVEDLGRQIGWLHDVDEVALARAIILAYDLDVPLPAPG